MAATGTIAAMVRSCMPPQELSAMSHKLTTPAAVAAALVALMAAAPASAADYVQDAGSTLVFATKYDGEVFTGTFPGFSTKLSFDPADLPAGRLDVTIPLAGAKTGNDDRDTTLRGANFFNVARFAQAHYRATGFRSLGGDRYAADGTLELRGVSKPVTLTFTWTPGAAPVLAGKATVKRLDFGVGGGDWSDTATIPDEVAVSTKVVFKPAQ
jgi:polyisoprenoid-binding protein YceI